MAHDNPVFYVTSNSDFVLNEINRQRNAASGDATQNRDIPSYASEKGSGEMASCRWRWNWFVNAFLISSLLGMIVLLEFDIITFRPLGFYCKDPKLSHKFMGDTVPFTYLLIITTLVPLIGIAVVETLVSNQRKIYTEDKKENLKGLKQAWFWYCQFIFGLLLVIFITEAGKSIVAEPRPHFLDTCKPDKAINCTSGYFSHYTCTNVNVPTMRIRDSYRSFPSGHSALGLYMAVFMIWFFQNRIPKTGFLIVPWLQCVFLFWGILCSLTRITDRRHHWWDVLAGASYGVLVAVFTVKVFCHNFFKHHVRTIKPEKLINDGGMNIRHPSSRRLLSSTSSCGTPNETKDPRSARPT